MIPTRIHGLIDYAAASLLAALAGSARLGAGPRRALGAAGLFHASYSLGTDYEAGLARLVPMRRHLALDALGAAALCGAGLGLRRATQAERGLLVGIGLAELAIVALSDAGPGPKAGLTAGPAVYPPLDVPKPVAEGVWIVDSGPHRVLGLDLPVRMTVIRLAGGDLLLHSPTRFDPALWRALAREGRVRHLVAPNVAHWSYLRDWQLHCPEALTWAAPGLRQRPAVRRAGVRIDHELGEATPAAWAAEIDLVLVPGGGGFREAALFHRPSRTLVLTDLIVNLDADRLPAPVRPVARLLGVVAPDGRAPAYLRAVVKLRRAAARDAAARLVALAPQRVIFAHGRWFVRDGAAALRRSLSWLLG